jgi:DNA-binding NarL/FixJ family response regulator
VSVATMMGLALVPAPPTPSEPFLAGVLDHIEAAAAALPSRPDAALRELRAARSLLLTRLRPVPPLSPALVTADPVRLTARESQVLRLLAEGDRNKEIALHLRLRERTVKFHVANLLHKLGAQSRTEALRRAIELGLLQTGRVADE